jgi:hypothetical protein
MSIDYQYLLPHERLQEAEFYIEYQKAKIDELVSLILWSARRLPNAHKEFAYNELDEITNDKHERL